MASRRPVLSDFTSLAIELNVPKEDRLSWSEMKLAEELAR